MPRRVRVNPGSGRVVLPNGRMYVEQMEVTLTDEEWNDLDEDVVESGLVTDLGAVGGSAEAGPSPATAVSAGATHTVDFGGGEVVQDVTLTQNCTLSFQGATDGFDCRAVIRFIQGGAGGYALTFPSSVKASNGEALPLTKIAGRYDTLVFRTTDGGSLIEVAPLVTNIAIPPAPAPPSAPTSLQATAGNGQVVLSWVAPASPYPAITSYNLYRGPSAGSLVLVGPVGNVVSHTDTGLANGTTYYYAVAAVNASGEGSLSAVVSATPAAAVSRWLVLPGATGSFAHTPVSAGIDTLDAATKIEIRARINPDVLNVAQNIVERLDGQFYFFIDATGKLVIQVKIGGVDFPLTATAALSAGDQFVRATLAMGATNTAKFYACTSKTDLGTQIGTTVSNTGATGGLTASADGVIVGAAAPAGAALPYDGKIGWVQVGTGITEDADFAKRCEVDFAAHGAVAASGTFVANQSGETGETWTLYGTAAVA